MPAVPLSRTARRRRARCALAALLAALAVAGIAAAAVPAGTDREALERDALRLVGLPAADFGTVARTRPAPYDWSTDGCSHTPHGLALRFAAACLQHDFAYRNLGRGLRLRSDERTRRWADGRFLMEMRRRCAELFAGLRRRACRVTARTMWVAVRRFGPRWGEVARAAACRMPRRAT